VLLRSADGPIFCNFRACSSVVPSGSCTEVGRECSGAPRATRVAGVQRLVHRASTTIDVVPALACSHVEQFQHRDVFRSLTCLRGSEKCALRQAN
jgi:hypothetical protein